MPNDRIIDGRDIWPLLTKPDAKPVHDYFFYFRKDFLSAVRDSEWKLHVRDENGNQKQFPELYNLKYDIGEKHNVADRYPEVVARLKKAMEKAADDIGDGKPGPGSRPPGKIENPITLIPSTYKKMDYWGIKEAPAGTRENDLSWLADQPRLVTAEVNRTINSCAQKGGGTIVFGPGTYGIGQIKLQNNVILKLDRKTVLIGSPYPDHYRGPSGKKCGGLFVAENASGFGITGEGTIDGNMIVFENPQEGVSFTGRPSCLMQFSDCKNFVIEGLKIINSPKPVMDTIRCSGSKIMKIR